MPKVKVFQNDRVIPKMSADEFGYENSRWYCLQSAIRKMEVEAGAYCEQHGVNVSFEVCDEEISEGSTLFNSVSAIRSYTSTCIYAVFEDDDWAWVCLQPYFNNLKPSRHLIPMSRVESNEEIDINQMDPLECRFDWRQ